MNVTVVVVEKVLEYKMLFNYETSHVIIASYPGYAGGKFLLNCLGLSNQCYLQDAQLVMQQQQGKLTQHEKLLLLHTKLDNVLDNIHDNKIWWNDLKLGDAHLRTLSNLGNDNTFFCVVNHDTTFSNQYQHGFHIVFKNTKKFINWRLGLSLDLDRRLYPHLSQDWTDAQYTQLYKNIDDCYEWDTDWYFELDIFLKEIQKLYIKVGFTDFDKITIESFYKKYIKTLDIIAEQYRNN